MTALPLGRQWPAPVTAARGWRIGAGSLLVRTALVVLVIAMTCVASGEPASPWQRGGAQIILSANQARAATGLAGMAASPRLTGIARSYAEQMAAGAAFAHTGDDGSTIVTRAEAGGYLGWEFLAENLAHGRGRASPGDVVRSWLESSGHRDNLLSHDATETGAACVARAGEFWCVQLFGRRDR